MHFRLIFGAKNGAAATAMRADWQRELTAVQKDLGVEYVRFHGLLVRFRTHFSPISR